MLAGVRFPVRAPLPGAPACVSALAPACGCVPPWLRGVVRVCLGGGVRVSARASAPPLCERLRASLPAGAHVVLAADALKMVTRTATTFHDMLELGAVFPISAKSSHRQLLTPS